MRPSPAAPLLPPPPYWDKNTADETESIIGTYDANNNLTVKRTEKITKGNGFYSRNEVGVLLGIGGMGFKEDITTQDAPSNLTITKIREYIG
ncbi:MAG: hypothetical protein LBQ88_22685 [Treponema sp.]|jgi:hypothetical protein|nr:hypothetical protein [Treponema sp.]